MRLGLSGEAGPAETDEHLAGEAGRQDAAPPTQR